MGRYELRAVQKPLKDLYQDEATRARITTLAVSRDVPVGFTAIRVRFELQSDAPEEELDTLMRLTERYCVVFQSLAASPALSVSRVGVASE